MKLSPINYQANQIRNLKLFDNKKEDTEMKQEMIKLLKTKIGYTDRNKKDQSAKRERRGKIREMSGNDPEKIASLRKILYTEEEKRHLDPCPFPQHKSYAELWKNMSSEQQKEMEDNIRVTADGKIEIIKMKKKFSALTAKHNGEDIFDGGHVDKNLNIGIKWVTYLTGKAAEREAKNQWKKLLKDKSEVERVINFFPGRNTKEKIFNFIKLFNLEKAGYWSPNSGKRYLVDSVGYVNLSNIDTSDDVYGLTWTMSINSPTITYNNYEFSSPYLVFEDC